MLMASALALGKNAAALLLFLLALLMLAYDQWGKLYDEHGKFVFAQRQVMHEARVQEWMAALRMRFGRKKENRPIQEAPSQPTASKLLEEAGLPPVESPPLVRLDSEPATPQDQKPSVTHPT